MLHAQGLYHMDEIFGPGVLTYSDGRQDVGLWLGKRLLKLCTSVEESFSLTNFPEYADFMKSTGSWTQVLVHFYHLLANSLKHCHFHSVNIILFSLIHF